MSNLTFWHGGKQYDFADAGDRGKILSVIDYNQQRSAIGDQTMLTYSIMGIIAQLTDDLTQCRMTRDKLAALLQMEQSYD